jgi:hypothetical protein
MLSSKNSRIVESILKNAVDHIVEKYFKWVNKFNKGTARQKVNDLQNMIDRTMAAASRASERYDDSGPIELASEKVEPWQNQIDLLNWYIKNSDKKPPKKLLDAFTVIIEGRNQAKQERQEKQKTLNKYPSLIGKRIFWKSIKIMKMENGIVIQQRSGRDLKPKYKVKTDNRGIWNVPHSLVKKIVAPRSGEDVVKKHLEQKQKLKEKVQSFKIGQKVEWNSKKCRNPIGKIVGIGRTKLKIQTVDQFKIGLWLVPIRLIIKVDGKKI